MYAEGKGIPQDIVLAYMWFNLSAAQGLEDAIANRDKAGSMLVPADLADAQKRARECLASDYKNCD
jgi:TPR repeat protein